MSRIVQVANFVTPTSGGLRTTLGALATGYAAAGHEVVQVLPGPRERVTRTAWGRRVELPGRPVPGTGYRVHPSAAGVQRVLAALAPDRLEVHDRTTLRGLGRWAAGAGVPALVVSHERLDRWLATVLPVLRGPAADRLADRANTRLAAGFDVVVCTTGWAATEFTRLGVPVARVPLGVDAAAFTPDRSARAGLAAGADVLLVLASRLSREKRPGLALDAAAELARRGRRVRLVVAGDGPLRPSLARRAAGRPVHFLGHVADRATLAGVLGAADAVLAPGPVETFGLAALEAAACGTPVVANRASALPSVLAGAGVPAAGSPAGLADAVEELLAGDEEHRRDRARQRAEQLPWERTVAGFLAVHGLARDVEVAA